MNAEERIAELLGESTADFEAERLILNATLEEQSYVPFTAGLIADLRGEEAANG